MGPAETVMEHEGIYYQGDNEMTLTPVTEGTGYHWYPEENVSVPTLRSPILTEFAEEFTVKITMPNDCDVLEKFHLILDCDTLYPDKNQNTTEFYYRYVDSLPLEASMGDVYRWEPQINLSAYDVQSPTLLDFHDFYTVYITDRYGCEFYENFHILLHCDTLYPGGNIVVLDTTLTEEGSFLLEPLHGHAISEWSPPYYLSCSDCEAPLATPRSNVDYSVLLLDEFNCEHEEIWNFEFEIDVPNVITPNGDGTNDCLDVFGIPPDTRFHVFDKTGNILFSAPWPAGYCWPGTDKNGRLLKSGTYWYAFDHLERGTLKKGFVYVKY
jgi:gliding motility-associated-like protein